MKIIVLNVCNNAQRELDIIIAPHWFILQKTMNHLLNRIESTIRAVVTKVAEYLPVKVIRDDKGVPFLYRYQLFSWSDNGPGLCLHRFVRSDPHRGSHSHPWQNSMSFILCGEYEERILTEPSMEHTCSTEYYTVTRRRWNFNYLNGSKTFHRVMVEEGKDVWTIFAYQTRSKTWGMIDLQGNYRAMSQTIKDTDGGWWKWAKSGFTLNHRVPLKSPVIATVDIVIVSDQQVLLIKRGKDPFKGCWAFPGGRIEPEDTDILSAAYRELKEETSIDTVELKFHSAVGNRIRDPRGFCVSLVYVAKDFQRDNNPKARAGDDAVDMCWFDMDQLPKMAFDHFFILNDLCR